MELNPLLITEAELQAELAAIEAEAIGWLPLGDGAYLHLGKPWPTKRTPTLIA